MQISPFSVPQMQVRLAQQVSVRYETEVPQREFLMHYKGTSKLLTMSHSDEPHLHGMFRSGLLTWLKNRVDQGLGVSQRNLCCMARAEGGCSPG